MSSAARRREGFRRRLLETRESVSDEEQEAEGARDPDGGSDEDDA